MTEPTFADIQEILNQSDLSDLPEFHISVLRNIMLEPIKPYVQYDLMQIELLGKIRFGAFDNIYQEAVGGSPELLSKQTHAVLILMHFASAAPELARVFSSLSSEHVSAEIRRFSEMIDAVLRGIRQQTDAMILWPAFELEPYPALGVWDSQTGAGQSGVLNTINSKLREQLRATPNAYFLDTNLCIARIGARSFYDPRYWHIGRAPFTRQALRELSREILRFVRPLKGKNKKCLVLDCDNTLWGGIIGEDLLSGIKLGKNPPGSTFYEFQQEVLNLYHRGIILALCSRNNESDVWEVFGKHPDMLIKEKHIATAQINWGDKATNLRRIASDLNIGLDSLVFLDDSEFEVNLVRQELPEVEVIHMPKDQPATYRHLLASCGLFDTLTLSDEDKKRGAMYKAEAKRKELQTDTTDMNSYYQSLEMVIEIKFADDFSIPRIAQQTQKTNQFNLTTRRYTEVDITNFANSDKSDVFRLRLEDRFGDSGIVGTCILRYEGDHAVFDSLLLSCRVLGRGVEDAFLIHALKLAKKRGCSLAIGEYYKTKKNAQVETFFGDRGFEEVDASGQSADRIFHSDLSRPLAKVATYFKEIRSDIDKE